MKYRKLDSAGDYVIGSGADFLVNSPEAVAQAISTRLKLWKGEWFVNKNEGTPWNQEVLGKRYAGRNPDSVIKQRILGTDGVTGISSYSSSYDGNSRQFSVTATVETQYGAVQISEVL